MANVKAFSEFAHFPRFNSTELKRDWKHVINGVKKHGTAVIYNHNDPEVVIVSVDEFQSMLSRIKKVESPDAKILADLTRRFDENLSILQSESFISNVDLLFANPSASKRRPKAGNSY